MSFNTTVVRLEHVPKDSETGMSLEIHVARYGVVKCCMTCAYMYEHVYTYMSMYYVIKYTSQGMVMVAHLLGKF